MSDDVWTDESTDRVVVLPFDSPGAWIREDGSWRKAKSGELTLGELVAGWESISGNAADILSQEARAASKSNPNRRNAAPPKTRSPGKTLSIAICTRT